MSYFNRKGKGPTEKNTANESGLDTNKYKQTNGDDATSHADVGPGDAGAPDPGDACHCQKSENAHPGGQCCHGHRDANHQSCHKSANQSFHKSAHAGSDAPDGASASPPSDSSCHGTHALAERIAQLESELASAREQYIRTMADVENARKRAQREKEDAAKFGASLLAKDVVLFVDNLERALLHSPNAAAPEEVKSFIDGIAMTAKDVIATLERHGICKINSNGQPFDPELHQAVAEVPTENEPGGMVFDTLQTGYTINGRLLRAAMVAVTKNT